MLGGSVEVTFAEDDHSDVGVEVDLAGFRACKPVTNEILFIGGSCLR